MSILRTAANEGMWIHRQCCSQESHRSSGINERQWLGQGAATTKRLYLLYARLCDSFKTGIIMGRKQPRPVVCKIPNELQNNLKRDHLFERINVLYVSFSYNGQALQRQRFFLQGCSWRAQIRDISYMPAYQL